MGVSTTDVCRNQVVAANKRRVGALKSLGGEGAKPRGDVGSLPDPVNTTEIAHCSLFCLEDQYRFHS